MQLNIFQQFRNSLKNPNYVPFGKALVLHLSALLILLAVLPDFQEKYFNAIVTRPFLFKARHALGQNPPVDERLKIYGIDDDTFFFLGDWVLSTQQWVRLIEQIASAKPKAIVIDSAFFKIIGEEAGLKNLAPLGVPIYVGGSTHDQEFIHRTPFKKDAIGPKSRQIINANAFVPQANYYFSYAADYQHLFSDSGHFMYDNNHEVTPVLAIKDQFLVPHLSLLLSQSIDFLSESEIRIDGQTIHLTADAKILVNFDHPDRYYKKTYSLEGLLKKASKRQPIQSVQPGDVVLIIPQLYTGNTDIRQTPFGPIPGGYIIAAMLNSVLQKNWLNSYMQGDWTLSLLAGCLSFGIVFFFSNLIFLLSVFSLSCLWVAAAVYLFAYHGLEIPFLNPLLSFAIPGMLIYFMKNRQIERHTENLRHAFEGHVPEETMQLLMQERVNIQLETSKRVLTVMFIDLVGFSIFSHHLPPKAAFQRLQEMMDFIIKIVHEHGGMIDRTLGDGLLCYFGYSFDNVNSLRNSENHADNALQCALELQHQNIRRIFEGIHQIRPNSFPMRIGINTAACYVGNIGSKDRIDFTVVGNGVNFAKRLESCCNTNHILISEASYRFLKDMTLPKNSITKRLIRIKHHDQDIPTFEFNPYAENQSLMDAVERYYQNVSRQELLLESWQILDDRGIRPIINGKIAEFILLTLNKIHLRSFSKWADRTEVSIEIEISPDGGVTAKAPAGKITGQLHFLNSNSDQSYNYIFFPQEQDASAFGDLVAFVNKHSVTDSNINPTDKIRQVVYGAR